jgi:hypothetical protein
MQFHGVIISLEPPLSAPNPHSWQAHAGTISCAYEKPRNPRKHSYLDLNLADKAGTVILQGTVHEPQAWHTVHAPTLVARC